MKDQTENRRVRMTKRLMKDALLELLEQSVNHDFSSRLVDLLCSQHIRSIGSVDEQSLRFMQRYVAKLFSV